MKYVQITLLTIIFFCASFYTLVGQAAQPLDKVVAVVNDDVITQNQLNQQINIVKGQMLANQIPLPSQKKLARQVLNKMIDQKIEIQMAERYGISVSDEDVAKAVKNVATQNNMSVEQLQQAVQAQGMTWKQYRQQMQDQLLVTKVLQRAVGPEINITDQELKNAELTTKNTPQSTAEYNIGDILISLPDEPSSQQLQQANAQANQIITQLKKGANFQQLAEENSTAETALNGGDLGWRTLEELPTIFASQITTMKIGDIAGPIRTGNGLHIIKLLDVKKDTQQHYVTETKVRHILIKTTSPAEDAAAKAEIQVIRKKIVGGASFAEMAKQYSEDAGSASKGGEIGWVRPGILVPPFEQAMNALPVGQLSQPVKTEYGWHLIQVEGRRQKEDTKNFQRGTLKQQIYERKFQEQAAAWVQRMKDASYIKIMLDNND